MSITTLKTTLKVESPALFPSQRGYAPFIEETIVPSAGNYMEISVTDEGNTPLTNTILGGGEGSYVYIKASESNPSHTAINIYGTDEQNPFMTLHAGESCFVPVSYAQKTLSARATFGSASLTYFYSDKGRKAGQSVMIWNIDSVAEDNYWYYAIIDTATGGTPKWINTGYNRSDWNMYMESVVNDKGYVLRFYNNNEGFNDIQFVNNRGEMVSNHLPQNGFGYNAYQYVGRAYVIFYQVGEGQQAMSYFDGENEYYHEFDYTTDIYLDSNYDRCTQDGTITVYAEDYDDVGGREVVFLINKDQKVMISDINYNDDYYYVDTFVNYYANFVALQTWDDDNNRLVNLKIFATDGTLLKTVNFNSEDDINNTDYNFYGTGKLQIVYEDANDTTYTLLNYNERTGVLLGFDKDWKHESGEIYNNYNLYCQDLGLWDDDNSAHDGMAIIFESYEWSSGTLNKRPYFMDVTYLFDGQTEPKNYVVHGGGLGDFYYSDYTTLTSNTFAFLYGSTEHDSNINAYLFSKDKDEPKNIQLIDDRMSNYDWNSWWNHDTFGDYCMFQYNSTNYDTTTYVVYTKDGVLDTLVIPNSYEGNYRTRVNSLFIREWYDAQSCWYFDTKINKFVLIPEFYSQRGWSWSGTEKAGINNGKMVLVKPEYYGDTNNVEARILDNGLLSEKVVLLNASEIEWDNMFWIISDETFAIAYRPNGYYVVDVYDLNLKYLYTVETGLNNWFENTIVCNNRLVTGFESYGTSDPTSFYSFGKKLGRVQIPDDAQWNWTANDVDWWDN